MTQETGFYYLHENGELIWKRYRPEQDPGGFVKRVWFCDPEDRLTAWIILVEGLAFGANVSRVKELAGKWACDGQDLTRFVVRHKPTPQQVDGMNTFIAEVLGVEPDLYWNWLEKTPTGREPDFSTMPTNTKGSKL